MTLPDSTTAGFEQLLTNSSSNRSSQRRKPDFEDVNISTTLAQYIVTSKTRNL